MYQETLQFYHLWRLAVQERDEAREHLKHSLTKLSQFQELFDTILLSEEQKLSLYYPQTTDEATDQFSGDSPSQFSSAPPMDFVSNSVVNNPSPASCDSDSYSFQSNKMGSGVENLRDFETVVLEMIGGVLPENGKFLQTVSEAGSLVESLFITGPIPKWRNPPVQLSSQRPVLRSNITGNWKYGGLEFGSGILNRSFPSKMSQFSLMS
ncbi:unnamed protein product [Arabis nemorensis]|uniref:Uncharacterized protein n=1 Tax=Arabis nemorensis TaxID=586526 RepID=A0A565CJR3_9BRAS|nr:unnamed protein product [Arabis nemorensis]